MKVTRRNLLKGGAAVMAGLAATAGVAALGCKKEEEPEPKPAWMPEAWDGGEADFVVLGTGSAGLSAAITIKNEELGTVLILEAAPEELRGGNSCCSGNATFCPKSVDAAIEYQTALNGPYTVEPELLRAWAENLCQNGEWLDQVVHADLKYVSGAEFPEMPRADQMGYYADSKGTYCAPDGRGGIWTSLYECAQSYEVPMYFNARGIELVADPVTKEVYGVKTEDGRYFKASKAVILACGGFEWNEDMMNMYMTCGFNGQRGRGTMYNRGDGILMAQRLGAKLWHMNNISGSTFGLRVMAKDDDIHINRHTFKAQNHDYIFVDPEGKRFMYEESRGLGRHGKVYTGGTWQDLRFPKGSHAIFGQASYDTACVADGIGFSMCLKTTLDTLRTNDALLAAGIITKSETVAELAKAIGAKEEDVQGTLDYYNESVEQNYDRQFHRGQPLSKSGQEAAANTRGTDVVSLNGFDLTPIEPPYYSYEMIPCMTNTQGGLKRSAKGEVMDMDEKPIPRLYAAGEMGTVYVYNYNIGGNFGEAISSGRLAARSAATLDAWDAVPEEAAK